jgi:hypothetical protein
MKAYGEGPVNVTFIPLWKLRAASAHTLWFESKYATTFQPDVSRELRSAFVTLTE